jgi:CheY-like chemotaxis protein
VTIRILIADDHEVVRQGLRTFIESDPELEVVGEAGDGAEATRADATQARGRPSGCNRWSTPFVPLALASQSCWADWHSPTT